MSIHFHAARDFVARYARVASAAWKARRGMESIRRTADELEFLPAQLELIDTPVSRSARWFIRLIAAFFCAAVAWAYLGKVDVVAVASGRTVGSMRTKIVQPLDTGVVRSILVRDGDRVVAGQLLVELDSTSTVAEAGQAQALLTEARLLAARMSAELDALDTAAPPSAFAVNGASAVMNSAANRLAKSEIAAHRARRASLDSELSQRRAELATLQAQIRHLAAANALATQRAADVRDLVAKRYASNHDWLTAEQSRIDAETQLNSQQSRIAEIEAAIAGKRQDLAALDAEFRRQQEDMLREATTQVAQLELEFDKASRRDQLTRIVAPVDGTVQQLVVHSVGGVVTPAQALMAIVPERDELEVEAMVLNRDIGFVNEGDPVTLKVESFPYTRHGHLQGVVAYVSKDALPDEQNGAVFLARVKVVSSSLHVDGRQVNLTPGMSVMAEIKTGQRRVIDFLIDPVRRVSTEALRER